MIDRSWRAHTRFNPASCELSLTIGRPIGDGDQFEYVSALGLGGLASERTIAQRGERPPEIHIQEDLAKTLLESLAEYFGGTGDTRMLRRDYDAERARVDRLMDRMCQPPIYVVGGEVCGR